MTRTNAPQPTPPTFDSLEAIDSLEAAGFDRKLAAALSEQLLLAANNVPTDNHIEKQLDELARVVASAIRESRLISVGFTVLNIVIFVAILVSLELA